MFSCKNKLDSNLKYLIANKCYKSYRVLIEYKNLKDVVMRRLFSKGSLVYSFNYLNIICANLSQSYIEKLIEYPEISRVVLDEYLFLCGVSVATANKYYASKNSSLTGKNIGIGLVDSGVYPHSNLLYPHNNIKSFSDTINGYNYPYDDNGHGTHMAGIICSNGSNSDSLYKGIAPNSKLYTFKAFDKLGKGFFSDIIYSIESLLKMSNEHNIKILCLPFELLTHNIFIINAFKSLFNICIQMDIIPIVPSGSGKSNLSSIMGIAALDNCITVGGLDTLFSTKLYDFSPCGPYQKKCKPNFCAACTDIISLNSDTSYYSEKNNTKLYPPKLTTEYKSFSGTSIATAYVSGLCALLYEKDSSLTFKDILSLLTLCCDPLDGLDKSQVGEGVLNVTKLLSNN